MSFHIANKIVCRSLAIVLPAALAWTIASGLDGRGIARAQSQAIQAGNLYDNWLSRLMEDNIQGELPGNLRHQRWTRERVDHIIGSLWGLPQYSKPFMAKRNLRYAVEEGVKAYVWRLRDQGRAPFGPTPAQVGAARICEVLGLPYPPAY